MVKDREGSRDKKRPGGRFGTEGGFHIVVGKKKRRQNLRIDPAHMKHR